MKQPVSFVVSALVLSSSAKQPRKCEIFPIRPHTLTAGIAVVWLSASPYRTSLLYTETNKKNDSFEVSCQDLGVSAPPLSYMLDGKQYIAVAAGASMMTFAMPAAGH